MENPNRLRETEGIIVSIKTPFKLFKKANPVVAIRTKRGSVIKMEATNEMIAALPITIGVGMYTQAQYKSKVGGTGYELIALF